MSNGARTNGTAEVVRLEIPATLKHLNIIGACLHATCERLSPPPAASDVQATELAVQEACTNIVTHAYAGAGNGDGRIVVELSVQGRDLVVDLIDSGATFDPSGVAEPDLENPHEHGYGVFLMHQLMDSVEYTRQDGRNRLRLRKVLEG